MIQQATIKEQRWYETYEQVMQLKDKLGKGIDAGIVDTVVILNVLNITTTQSCEGHLEWGRSAPWVDIEDIQADKEADHVLDLFNAARTAYSQGQSHEPLFEQAHQAKYEVMKKQLTLRNKLMMYLTAFYEQRHVPYDVQLVIQSGSMGRSRLESQGSEIQEIASPETRASKLAEYQAEMQAFTEFLKRQYYAYDH